METKKWYQSKTIWGSIIMLLSMVMGSVTGVQIGQAEQDSTANTVVALAEGLGTLVGFILTIIGRIKANKTIGGATAAPAAKAILIFVLLAGLIGASGCATLQGKWQSATEDEKARLILADMQATLDSMLDFGTIYVVSHPDKKADWQTRVLPLFKSANDMIGENIRLAKANAGKVTVAGVLSAVQPKIAEIEVIVIQWGFSKR